jgi:hypothetical protein
MLLLPKIPALHAVITWRVLWLVALALLAVPGSSCFDSATEVCRDCRRCNEPDCWGYCTPSCPPGAVCDPTAPTAATASATRVSKTTGPWPHLPARSVENRPQGETTSTQRRICITDQPRETTQT